MRAPRLVLPALLALAAFGAPAGASAADGLDVRVSPSVAWPDRQLLVSLPDKQVLDEDRVAILENGEDVRGVRVRSEADNRKRGVVLAIDASLTMRGEPIRQAIVAARGFARRRGENTSLGVLFFSGSARVALAPTTDRRAIRRTLAVGPELSRGTRIFDAAAAGIDALKTAGMTSGAVVVLSDGAEAENGSTTPPQRLTALARRANVRVFTVGLASRSFDSAPLRELSATTGGRYGQASRPRDLPPLFAAIGERLSSEYLVDYQSVMPAGQPVVVETQVAGVSGRTEVGYRAPKLALAEVDASPAPAADGLDGGRVGVLAAASFALLTLVGYLLLRPRQRSVVARVGDFAPDAGAAMPTMADVRAADERRERKPSERWRRYADAVELADIGVTPGALALWTAIATVLVAWYAIVVAGRAPLALLAVAIPILSRMFVSSRLTRRRRAFQEQLPDNLQVMASALRAGYSFSAAMAAMAHDAPEPSRTELLRASNDEQLGVDVGDALKVVAERMASPEIEYVGIVARMQRETGGNTAEILDQVMATIRERLQLKRMVRTLTAQGRMSGAVISAMPIIVGFGMAILNPGYFDPMFGSPIGVALFLLSGVLLGVGWLFIRKIVDVEP